MTPTILKLEQRTDEWYEARLGKATASRFKDILAVTKSGMESAARRNYRAQLVVERLTGITPDRFTNSAMEWGTETEDLARTMYMLETGNTAEEAGFYIHPALEAGASPDGIIGRKGRLEIKCRNTANHIETLKTGKMPIEYMPQIQGQLWLSNGSWCDFVSFDPDMPANAQFFVQRIKRNDEYILLLESAVADFLKEVDEDVKFITKYRRAT